MVRIVKERADRIDDDRVSVKLCGVVLHQSLVFTFD
jgi:hypothetical protein